MRRPMEYPADIGVIGTVVARSQPVGLRIRHQADLANFPAVDGRRLSFDEANLESGILGLYDDFMLVKPIESFGGVLAG
jgi:hypothetical protein